jgi:hypothetical protein
MQEENRLDVIKKINDKIFSSASSLLTHIQQKNLVFIYTPPKVGSTCLVTSIRLSASNKFCVLHLHDEVMLNFLVDGVSGVTVNEIIMYNHHIGKNVYVIDVYRTPIERKFSEFFEKISVYHFNNTENNINNYELERITNRFNNVFPYLSLGDHYADKFGINVLPFEEGQLYDLQVVNGISYIKLRIKDSSKWGKILTKLLQTEITIIWDYETKDKDIGATYKKFKDAYILPANFFNMIENDKYLSLYYPKAERNEYLEMWRKKSSTNLFDHYSQIEYNFYVNLYMENQFYNDFQLEHYVDCGCLCSNCSTKRNELLHKARRGYKINEKIIHAEIAKEMKAKEMKIRENQRLSCIKKIKLPQSEVSNVMNLSSSNKIKRNTMSIVIGTK